MAGWMERQTDGWMDGCVSRRVGKCTESYGQPRTWMSRGIGVWMNGRKDRQIDRQMDR